MANNTRQYSIVINGVEQSVKAVDALLQKIDALDERITKLQKLNIDLGAIQNSVSKTDNSGSKYDAAKSEAAAQKEIANQIALQNAENQKALQLLVQKKQETKEQVKIQQQIAQGVRDTNGEYANTLNGQRALLSEMKKQIGNMDIDDAATRAFAEQINQVTEKIKEMEEAYGTFTRNVGNYKSAAEGFQGFNITIGETVRNFGSLREAAKTIKNEMMGIDTTTAEGKAQFEAYEQALHDVSVAQVQMSDAAERAATSAKGLHDVLEMMEGLTAVAGIGQGISSLFGLDDTGLGEQITKLQSLMTILQSIKTLQDQMERGVGGGGWIMKLWKGLDNPIASLKKLSAGLRTTKTDIAATGTAAEAGATGMTLFSAATTTATVAVKAFAKATVLLFVLQLVAEAVDLLIEGFKKLGSWLFSIGDDSEKTERKLNDMADAADGAADAVAAYEDELSRQRTAGFISEIEESILMLQRFDNELQQNTKRLQEWFNERDKADDSGKWYAGTSLVHNYEEAVELINKQREALNELEAGTDEYEQAMADHGRTIARIMIDLGNVSSEEVAKFINALNSEEFGKTALDKMLADLPEASRTSFEAILKNFYSMSDQMANRAAQLHNEIVGMIASIDDAYNNMFDRPAAIAGKYDKMRKQLKDALDAGQISVQEYDQRMTKIDAMHNQDLQNEKQHQEKKTAAVKSGGRARVKATQSSGRARVSAAKNTANELEAVEKRIQNDKISAMRDGLAKTLAQLDLERRNRVEQAEKIRKLGEKGEEKYQEELASITALYAKKEFDAKKEWADKWEEYREQIMRQTEQGAREYQKLVIEYLNLQNQNWMDNATNRVEDIQIHNLMRSVNKSKEAAQDYYDIIKRLIEIRKEIVFNNTIPAGTEVDMDKVAEHYRELKEEEEKLLKTLDFNNMTLRNPDKLFQSWEAYYEILLKKQKDYAEKMKETNIEQIGYEKDNALFDENEEYDKIVKDIEEKYKQHLEDMRALQSQEVKDKRDQLFDILDIYGVESDEYAQAYEEYKQLAEDEILLTEDKNNQLEWAAHMHELTVQRIEDNANEKRLKAQNDYNKETQTATANFYSGLLNELQRYQNTYQQKVDKLSEKSKNAWGIVNLSKYSKGINTLREQFKKMADDIENRQRELIRKLANNEISLGDFNTAYTELDELKNQANETLESLNNMSKNKIGEFIESINTYIQSVGQGLQELLSTVWDAQSAALDAQQEALEKANSELEKQLSKQQEITQRHADKINQIEDELSTARGDRRQHLIDSLSAQIAAQRASLAAEQRIQKQKEANEKKQDALDKKRKEAQRKQDITSAIISTALATANGLATKPFVPVGIAMGALAAALGAAQVAIISSKHYAKGGVLDGGVAEGPRHSQGGIKVLGGRAEIEGGEFITNRRTTKQNAGVLDFINSKKRKLNLDDFVEYYSKAGRRSVIGTRNKFADGGQLPELNDNVEVVNPSQTIIFNQDDRPIWVSVKDINDAQARVRNVQTLAGMR